jgi:membrane protease subunit HflK
MMNLLARLRDRLRRSQLIFNEGGRPQGPPDLDELWRDFNRKLSGLLSGKGGRGGGSNDGPGSSGGGTPPEFKGAGLGAGLIAAVAGLIWLGSGFFIVQEGQQAVVTSFGKYSHTADAGFQWRFPYPFQAHETVPVTQLRSLEVGRSGVVQATGLRDSSMLTQDENIVDIRFTVQYRLKDARAYLFENRGPDEAVIQASESAVREIVGRSKVDQVLYEQRDAIAADLVKSVQAQLDRLSSGIVVANINVQNVQVPEQVQAAFNDAVKAGADRDRYLERRIVQRGPQASDGIPSEGGDPKGKWFDAAQIVEVMRAIEWIRLSHDGVDLSLAIGRDHPVHLLDVRFGVLDPKEGVRKGSLSGHEALL